MENFQEKTQLIQQIMQALSMSEQVSQIVNGMHVYTTSYTITGDDRAELVKKLTALLTT